MTIAADHPARPAAADMARSPLLALGLALVGVMVLLSLPLRAPIGPMYWDVFIYYDAANRISDGQVPINDFFTPVGPLGYYLFAGWLWLFPDAQPSLIAHWSLLALTAPLMAIVLAETGRTSRATAFALLIPFLIFALLPFNTRDYYPYPGSDGFGIYNRQVCQMLYVLVAALVFMRAGVLLTLIVAAAMAALFLLKITGFVAGALICLFAFAAGRVPLKHAVASVLAFCGVLAVLELAGNLLTHYVQDILLLVEMNSATLAPRFLQAASHTFGVLLPGGALILLLLWSERERLAERLAALRTERSLTAAALVIDVNAFWLAAVLVAGIVFETQNTGSQAMIFVWPVVLAILMRSGRLMATPKLLIAVPALAAAIALPPAVNTVERAARAYVGSIKNVPLEHRNLKTLGALNMRDEVAESSRKMIDFYAKHEPVYEELVAKGKLPTPLLYSNFDFQIAHLIAIDGAIDRIAALEARTGVRFETILNINFVNPFPYLLGRSGPKHVAIGADPTRAVPPPGPHVIDAVRNVDLALLPRCPPTTANADLLALYGPMLKDHRRIALDACFDAFVHPRFADRID